MKKRIKDLYEYQLQQRERLLAYDDMMKANAITQMESRDNFREAEQDYEFLRQRITTALDNSMERLAGVAASSIEGFAERLQKVADKTGSGVLDGMVNQQNSLASIAQRMQRDAEDHAMEVGRIQIRIMRTLTAIEAKPARAAGGPVTGGATYQVNELGKEGFLSNGGSLKEINAPAYGSWRAPSSGTVIPAHIWSEVKASRRPVMAPGAAFAGNSVRSNEGALVAALATLSGGSRDSITNNVTIQSTTPVQAASDMLVQMTKIRNRRMR